LRKINDATTPFQKLQIMKTVTENLRVGYFGACQKEPSNDRLFPLVVYVVLFGNVDNLQSNLEYIEAFVYKSILQGKHGFVLTNVKAAVRYLKNLDG
jgi:hypothetical protein